MVVTAQESRYQVQLGYCLPNLSHTVRLKCAERCRAETASIVACTIERVTETEVNIDGEIAGRVAPLRFAAKLQGPVQALSSSKNFDVSRSGSPVVCGT
jgi:hypothetical protein